METSFWDKKSKADEARHCLMKAIKKANECCINFCTFLKEKPMLQNYEKCHHRSATDKFSSVLMGMQAIVLTGILLLTALEIGTQEMTDSGRLCRLRRTTKACLEFLYWVADSVHPFHSIFLRRKANAKRVEGNESRKETEEESGKRKARDH